MELTWDVFQAFGPAGVLAAVILWLHLKAVKEFREDRDTLIKTFKEEQEQQRTVFKEEMKYEREQCSHQFNTIMAELKESRQA